MMYFARWKVTAILVLLALGCIFAFPNLLPTRVSDSIPGWLPHERVSLGLDLRGGSHLLLEADIDSVVHERLTSIVDGIRTALRKANIGYTDLGVQGNTLKLRDPAAIETARPLLEAETKGLDLTIGDDGSVAASYSDAGIIELTQNVM